MSILLTALSLLCLALCCIGFYYKVKCCVLEYAVETIAENESAVILNSNKADYSAQILMKKVPRPLDKFLTKQKLAVICQRFRSWMLVFTAAYRKLETIEVEPYICETTERAAETISGLFYLSWEELHEKATELGLETNEDMTKKDIVELIVVSILNKA